jgi:cytochrome c biogenesis protein CcdA
MITKNLGMLLLAIYFILVGIMALFHTIVIPDTVKGILALAAGILILIGR